MTMIDCWSPGLPLNCNKKIIIKNKTMKRLFSLCVAICTLATGFAQTDSTKAAPDTIKIGSMTIIREKGSKPAEENNRKHVRIPNRKHSDKPSNTSTNWWIVDIGFSNVNDKTNYPS